MRITNLMISNTMRGNINRNQLAANRLMNQIAVNKRIGTPSENPLIATRHLRFSNALSQIEQHQRNVDQAQSWTEYTEGAMSDLEDVMRRIYDLINRVDAVEILSDRQIIARELEQLLEQKKDIMNTTFAGRYIFSGLRTNQPAFFVRDNDFTFHDLTLTFGREHMETTYMLDRSHPDSPPTGTEEFRVVQIHRIRLPHNGDLDAAGSSTVNVGGVAAQVLPRISGGPQDGEIDFYAMTDGIYHDPETGDIITLNRENFDDLFEDPAVGPGVGRITVTYNQTGFSRGDMNPLVFMSGTWMRSLDMPPGLDLEFHMESQDMEFEFGVHSTMPMNVLAMNTVTPQFFADLRGLIGDIRGMTTSHPDDVREAFAAAGYEGEELDRAVNDFLQRETSMMETVTDDFFNNFIGRFEGHSEIISGQHTDLGTRMSRLEMIGGRLVDDNLIFTELYTQNIGIDIADATTRLLAAEVALRASMQVGMHTINTLTLLNFL
ncbi:MAG: hypothetical protein FWG63_03500 [Defluviitaleaceae bacterium]|nr:hypothetical protein [Defluviitaleaceae bacterium]